MTLTKMEIETVGTVHNEKIAMVAVKRHLVNGTDSSQ